MKPNLILDSLPETVTVNGREFFVDADFRTFIRFEQILIDDEKDPADKAFSILRMCYPHGRPDDIEAAFNELIVFYRCGELEEKRRRTAKNGDVEIRPKMIYSFEHDAPYIFAAFLTQYGVDLTDVEFLHWWKFCAMFQGLNDDAKICKIMSYRAADLSKISDKKERSRIAKLQRIYAIPQNLTREEKIASAGAVFGGLM